MKRKNTILILILSTIVSIVVICIFIFIIKVIENKNTHILVTLATYQSKLKEKENIITFNKQVNEIKSLQDSINSYFVDPNTIDTFVNSLEEISSVTGASVSVKSIETSQVNKNTISFSLLIDGTFDQVAKTITFLENIPYQINITKVYLNKNIRETVDTAQPIGKTNVVVQTPTKPTWQADISFNILSL